MLLAFVLEEDTAVDHQRVREHLRHCVPCSREVDVLREIRRVESEAGASAPTTAGLVQILEHQSRAQRPSWSLLRRHPSLAAAAAALLALFFSAGFVQGSLMERRAQDRPDGRVVRSRTLPSPPDLGLLAAHTVSSAASDWSTDRAESVRVSPAVDSLPG
jgi:hypothetical protein